MGRDSNLRGRGAMGTKVGPGEAPIAKQGLVGGTQCKREESTREPRQWEINP